MRDTNMASLALGLLGNLPAIVTGVSGLVHSVEAIFGKGNGQAKKAAVVTMLPQAVSVYDRIVGGTSLPQISQPDFNAALGELVDSIVKFYNVAGVFTHSKPTEPPSSGPYGGSYSVGS